MATMYLRILGYAEGVSLLILLFIAMPAKYLAGMPALVRHVGMLHGILFLWFNFTLFTSARQLGLTLRHLLLAVVASSVPFGTFWFDRQFLASARWEENL